MKVKIIIKETIVQNFEVEVTNLESAYDEIREMYKGRKLAVEDPTLINACVLIRDSDSDWLDLHVN